MTKDEALRLALEALEDLARYEHPQTMIQIRKKDGGSIVTMYPHKVASDAITAIKAALEAKDEPVAWEEIQKVAQERYKVVPSDASMFYRFAVVAGDGNQQLFIGRDTECQVMAIKFTGAFLDGAFMHEQMTTPPQRKPLTDEEILTYRYMIDWTADWSYIKFARAIEAAHGIKGEA